MLLIDAHTHWHPDFVSRDPCGWARAVGEAHWGRLMAPRPDGRKNLQGFPSIEKFLRDMDAAGVERAVIQAWYWRMPENCEAVNAAVAEAVGRFPDRLSAFCAINPACGGIEARLRRARDMGFAGIGELHDGVQGFSFSSEGFAELCGLAGDFNMPLCVHLGDPDGKDYPNKIFTDNAAVAAAAEAFPGTGFILSHWGGGEVFKPGFKPLKNVFYDTAANTFLYGKSAWRKIGGALADRMIYGSDYPLRLYPSLSAEEEMVLFSQEALANVPSEFQDGFFSANFLSIYGIE